MKETLEAEGKKVTTIIDIRATLETKLRAAACHSGESVAPRSITQRALGRLLAPKARTQETFYRAQPPFRNGERIEHDFFEGVH